MECHTPIPINHPIKTTTKIPPLKSIKDKQGRDKHFKKTNDNRENKLKLEA